MVDVSLQGMILKRTTQKVIGKCDFFVYKFVTYSKIFYTGNALISSGFTEFKGDRASITDTVVPKISLEPHFKVHRMVTKFTDCLGIHFYGEICRDK